jgi:FkbM family methyltransferase
MLNRILRFAKIGLIALVVLGAVIFVFSRLNQPATTRAFFSVERGWVEHWPWRGRSTISRLEPALYKLGIVGPARVEVEPHLSFFLDPRDYLAATVLITGQWQPEVWDSLSPVLSEGGVLLDVGAHIGYFSLKASSKVGKTGRIVAFEPDPGTLKLLGDNVAANNAGNVTVEPIACTDREQMLTLWAAGESNTAKSSLSRQNAAQVSASEAPKPYTVRGRPIDDVVGELNLTRVDAIKIDVEGAEVLVLRGSVETLKRFHPRVVVEVIPELLASFQTTPDDLISLLKGAGYNQSRRLAPRGDDWEWTVR